ncbi:MAG: phosphoribosyltransferase [Streptosporangiaceae bacterium]
MRSSRSSPGSEESVSPPFADRAAAGRHLGHRLASMGLTDPLVFALPRGGVAVAYEVAHVLDASLDVLVTRKIGYPYQPELGVGAIAEGGEPVYDPRLMDRLGLHPDDLEDVVTTEREELRRRVEVYRGERPLPGAKGRDVVVVDDGLATGGTARAALRAVRAGRPRRLLLAAPVSAADTAEAIRGDADDVVILAAPPGFRAVGQWYHAFDQLTDDDVVALLEQAGLEQAGGRG